MKVLFIFLFFGVTSFVGPSQTLTVNNLTGCNVLVTVKASEEVVGSSPSVSDCIGLCTSANWNIPGGGTMVFHSSHLTPAPSTSPFYWTYLRFADPSYAGGTSCTPTGSCGAGTPTIGDPNCGLPTSDCISWSTCLLSCSGNFTATWTWLTATDAQVDIQ